MKIKNFKYFCLIIICFMSAYCDKREDCNNKDNKASVNDKISSSLYSDNIAIPLSMINLISTPERFDNKRVSVIGYISNTDEGFAIYLSKEDVINYNTRNSLWIIVDTSDIDLINYDEKYVDVTGIFKKNQEDNRYYLRSGKIIIEKIVSVDVIKSKSKQIKNEIMELDTIENLKKKRIGK